MKVLFVICLNFELLLNRELKAVVLCLGIWCRLNSKRDFMQGKENI